MSQNKNYKLFCRVLTALAVVGLVWLTVTHWPKRSDSPVSWPARSHTHTLLLRPATSTESIRFVDYASDQVTVTGMRIEYRDGTTALASYNNSRPVALKTYFADVSATPAADVDPTQPATTVTTLKHLNDGLATRKLKSILEFKSDGLTIKSLIVYSEDGNFASIAVRDSADDLAVTTYGGNGVAGIAKISSYDGSTGVLKTEQSFRADGTIESTFVSTGASYYPEAKQTFFDANGMRNKEVIFKGDYDLTINEYAADGKTLTQRTAFGYSSVVVTNYDSTGIRPEIERTFVDATHISVRYFDKSGVATLQQRWVKIDSTLNAADIGVNNDGFYLAEAYEFHPDGVSVKMDYTFYPGGKIVNTFENRPTTEWRPRTIQHFRADGTLESTEDCPITSYSCNSTTAVAPAISQRAKVPPHYFKVVPLLPAPAAEKPKLPKTKLIFDLR